MISENIKSIETNHCTIVSTIQSQVVSNKQFDSSRLEPCNHEEADTRVLLHVKDGSLKNIKKISILTVDTDVVVIAIHHFPNLDLEELWIEFGCGKSRRYLPIHQYVQALSRSICSALPLWYSITGCDTVSTFSGRGILYPEIISTFER